MIDEQGFRKVLERFTSTLVEPFGLETVLAGLSTDMEHVLEVAGAGVMLEDKSGKLRLKGSSSGILRQLENLQIELDEGPCLLAFRTGETVIAADLHTDQRFPRFGPRATAVGMGAVYSFPLRWGDSVLGALNLYRSEPGGFDDKQIEAGQTFAQVATVFLVHAEDVQESKLLNDQLQRALESRVLIEQAKGFVAGTRQIDPDNAFTVLRHYARNRGLKLQEVAKAVIDRRLSVDELPPDV